MKNSQLTTNTKSSSKYTEDWIPIKAISNGTILLDNKLKVTGVKIRPRNIFILDQQSQDSALIALKNFYNTIDFEFWLISADRPVDLNNYLARLQLLYNQTPNPSVRKLINKDIEKNLGTKEYKRLKNKKQARKNTVNKENKPSWFNQAIEEEMASDEDMKKLEERLNR